MVAPTAGNRRLPGVYDAPLSQKRAWLVESAESVNVATLAGDPAFDSHQ